MFTKQVSYIRTVNKATTPFAISSNSSSKGVSQAGKRGWRKGDEVVRGLVLVLVHWYTGTGTLVLPRSHLLLVPCFSPQRGGYGGEDGIVEKEKIDTTTTTTTTTTTNTNTNTTTTTTISTNTNTTTTISTTTTTISTNTNTTTTISTTTTTISTNTNTTTTTTTISTNTNTTTTTTISTNTNTTTTTTITITSREKKFDLVLNSK
ncbi:hypothetical protein M0804_014424 [Polistes exclamans]|nr:hypothetical protein M0804_014424 [Polistes exclamans]